MPAHLGLARRGQVRRDAKVGDGHDPLTRVAVRVSIGLKLFQVNRRAREPGALAEHARRSGRQVLVEADEPAGQGPAPGVWLGHSPPDESGEPLVPDRENDEVNGDRDAGHLHIGTLSPGAGVRAYAAPSRRPSARSIPRPFLWPWARPS